MSVDEKLLDQFLDGECSADETKLLIEWLESPDNLQRFAQRSELHAELRSLLRRKSIQASALQVWDDQSFPSMPPEKHESQASAPTTSMPAPRARQVMSVVLAAAASVLIAFVMWPDKTPPHTSRGKLATVVSKIDASLTLGDASWDRAELSAGDYQLRRGLLHLQFNGGVMVYVEAPAQFNLISGNRLVLQHGRLSASVPPEGIGFTVDTPEAEVVDFGTEFSIDVESGTSEVHVFDGLVRVQPRLIKAGVTRNPVDLRTSQAVKIRDGTEKPVDIEIATHRFIRNFDEPKRKYIRSLRKLSPVAFYRMAIRDKGLLSEPPQFSGDVLIGTGTRPPHARGVFAGGSLRVGASSTGRGGRVTEPPPLSSGHFTLAVFVYLDAPSPASMMATNIRDDEGNFALSLDRNGMPQAMVREVNGELRSVISDNTLPLTTWRHIVLSANGDRLRLYEDGQRVASVQCESMATSMTEAICFGSSSSGTGLWNGRIDELALFDRALSDREIAELYQAALEERARLE